MEIARSGSAARIDLGCLTIPRRRPPEPSSQDLGRWAERSRPRAASASRGMVAAHDFIRQWPDPCAEVYPALLEDVASFMATATASAPATTAAQAQPARALR